MIEKYKNKIEISFWLILMLLIGFNYSQLLSGVTSVYHPVWSDELFYYLNTYSFFQCNSLQAAFTFKGTGSILFGADAHGFTYPLLNGLFSKAVGWSNLNFILLNFIFLATIILIICLIKSITVNQKLNTIAFVLLFPFLPLYAFTYMQEVIHLLVAVSLSVLFYNISKKGLTNASIIYIVLIVLLAGIFRSLWLFWLIGLIPFAKSKQQLYFFLFLFIFVGISSLVYNKYLLEPVPNYFLSIIDLLNRGELLALVKSLLIHFIQNIKLYFLALNSSGVYFFMKYITFGSVIYFAYLAYKKKEKIYMSLVLIGLINFLLLFFFYDAFGWREIRTMSPLFYFFVLFIVISTKGIAKYLQLAALMILFIFTKDISKKWILERNAQNKLHNKEREAYLLMAKKIPDNKTVLVNYFPNNSDLSLIQMPLINANGNAIRYVVPYYGKEEIVYDYILDKPSNNKQDQVFLNTDLFVILNFKKRQ
jgi:hypothetical protein